MLTQPAATKGTFEAARSASAAATDWDADEWQMVEARLVGAAAVLLQKHFYRLVANLFTAAGHPGWLPAGGDTSNRLDLVLIDESDSLPAEIKSRTESAIINVKSVQQALENRVVLDQRAY
jgi:hypothetical protein